MSVNLILERIIGKNILSGVTDILPVVLVRYLNRLLELIYRIRDNGDLSHAPKVTGFSRLGAYKEFIKDEVNNEKSN